MGLDGTTRLQGTKTGQGPIGGIPAGEISEANAKKNFWGGNLEWRYCVRRRRIGSSAEQATGQKCSRQNNAGEQQHNCPVLPSHDRRVVFRGDQTSDASGSQINGRLSWL